jgi:hypothetical protein
VQVLPDNLSARGIFASVNGLAAAIVPWNEHWACALARLDTVAVNRFDLADDTSDRPGAR